ncbi:hypothetical protein F383_02660 [Gossypium arboreum]|uniref:Uncharacterized protein n=1 Tax=Gossypium arboreum TaxID=29729 RepID=A0A0B0PKF1_GOSAR|nr:hypothetical protein F383_02660 [Gossypium arboreum]
MSQRTKSTQPRLPHTSRRHGRVPLASLKQPHTGVPHERVPIEPKQSPIRKRPLFEGS